MTGSRASEDSFWSDLGEKELHEIKSAMRVRKVPRGERIVEEGDEARTLYIVNFGLFEVMSREGVVVAEIGAGQLIGEIGFFAGTPRTASVVAVRNSEVLEIARDEFEELSARYPEIQRVVTQALARRLAKLASAIVAHRSARPYGPARVATVIAAGGGRLGEPFLAKLRASVLGFAGACFLTGQDAAREFPQADPDPHAMASWLARIESAHGLVLCIADPELTAWSDVALRSSDQVLLVAEGEAADPNPVEFLAFKLFPRDRRRLLCVKPSRSGVAATADGWLRKREVFMTHHLAMQDDADFRSIARFLAGRAIGYVAGGGAPSVRRISASTRRFARPGSSSTSMAAAAWARPWPPPSRSSWTRRTSKPRPSRCLSSGPR